MCVWIHAWRKRNYENVKNFDLFIELDNVMKRFSTTPKFVRVI